MKLWRQTEALEPIDQVVGEQEQVEVGFVGEEMMAGDVAQCVVALELANDQFDAGAIVVEAPEVEWLQGQIGDQNLVVVAAELEQRELLARLLGLRSAYDHEAMGTLPTGGLVAKLGHLDAAAGSGVAQVREPALDGSGQPGDEDEACLSGFEPFEPNRGRKTLCRRGL